MTPGRWRERRPRRTAAVWQSIVFAVVALVGTGATTVAVSDEAGAVRCAPDATPDDRVAVVVDFGTASPAADGLRRDCVSLASLRGTTGRNPSDLDALRAVHRVGHDASGKVCQIGGIPATFDPTNCSEPQHGRLSYWAYFHGTATGWTYASQGAAGHRARPEVVVGWRYVTVPVGQQNEAAPPRNFTDGPSYAWQSTCPAAPVVTPRPPSGGGGGGGPVASPSAPRPSAASPGATPAAPPGVTTTPGGRGTTTTAPDAATTVTSEPDVVAPEATDASVAGLRSDETAPLLTERQLEEARNDVAAGRPVGAILAGAGGVGALTAALAVVTWRSRRRRALD